MTLRLAPSLPKFAVDSELPNVVSANTDTLKPSWVALNADRHEPKFDIPSTLKLLPNLVTSETEMVDQKQSGELHRCVSINKYVFTYRDP